MIFACSHLLVAAHYGTPEQCEFLEKVERLRVNAQNDEALQACNLKLLELGNQPNQSFYLKVAHEKAGILFALGDFEAARDFLRPLKNLQENNNEDFKAAWGDCMYALGKAYDLIEKSDSAIYFFKLALNVRLDLKYPNHEKLANNYSYLGYIYRFVKGEYSVAEQLYTKEGEELFKFDADDYRMAVHYMNLAACISQNDNEKALNFNFKALSFLGDSEEDMALKGQCLNNIANTYFRKNEFQRAIKYYKRSLQILPSTSSSFSSGRVGTYENLGSAYRQLGKLDSARIHQSLALHLNDKVHGSLSKEVYESKFHLSLCFSDLEKAKELRIEALRGKKLFFLESDEEMIRAYNILADWFKGINQTDSAFYYYQKAIGGSTQDYLSIPPKKAVDVTLANAVNNKALLLFEQGKEIKSWTYVSAAIEHYYLLSDLYDQLLVYKDSEIEQLNFVKNVKNNFNGAIEACFYFYRGTGKGIDDLWFFIERSKSAVLMLQAKEAKLDRNACGDQSAVLLKLNLNGRIKQHEEQLKVKKGKSDSLRLLLFELHKQLDSISNLLKEKELGFDDPHKVATLYETRKLLEKGKDPCIVQMHVGREEVYAIMVSSDTVNVLRIDSQDFEALRENCDILQTILVGEDTGRNKHLEYQTFVNSALTVYNLLLKPLGIKDRKEIIVIPDGFLSRIPFEALLVEPPISTGQIDYRNLKYLIRASKLTYGYSATWSGMSQKPIHRNVSEPSLLAFAYAETESQLSNQSLPGSAEEVNTVKRVWGSNIESFEGTVATKTNFKKNASNYDVIHLAIHNTVDADNPLNSGLEFRNDNFEDGILHVFEIYQLNIDAQMVVLSACESGVGEYQEGEGFSSVGRAFAQRGVANIISSLWEISDSHTSAMMSSFYKLLKHSRNPSSALHECKLRFIEENDELAAHPSNWASLIYTGNPERLLEFRDEKPEVWKLYFILCLLLVGFVIFWIRK